ncbi:hypothetical protein CWATWH0402_4026 [Crocosphaera watsonii WH 0402]|uniref:Uncharacterized protein n=1 Tax=Crocosphaera watsonii WH 0402 TaxID=1284629 RepID=T2JYB1_CROWT|nr:hypothetical protein CWATWH0402_4026 [Crocosphaera watsonii WH 0402]
MNSQEALEILAKDKEITGETYRVLFLFALVLILKIGFKYQSPKWLRSLN